MSDASDKELAFDRLIGLVQPNTLPTLSGNELEDILDRNQRAQRWTATTALTLGKTLMPTVRMGRVFRVIQEGTTGATEPTWPTGDEDTVVDGTATLINAGVDFENVYDVRGAAEECWALKGHKAVQLTVAGENFSQVAQQCQEQRKSFASVLIA